MILAFCLSLFLCFSAGAEEFSVPALKAPVTDQAQLMSRSIENQLNRALISIYKQGGPQLAILTVPSLHGLSIEEASIQVAEKWKLGQKEKGNGLLVLVSKKDRKVRIEVGEGLEGAITDAESSRIIRQQMVPAFRKGRYEQGLVFGVGRLLELHEPPIKLQQYFKSYRPRSGRSSRRGFGFVELLFLLAMLYMAIRHPALFFMLLLSGGRGRGGYHGGGGFGGGSFGGGGGGFSGGGASGSW